MYIPDSGFYFEETSLMDTVLRKTMRVVGSLLAVGTVLYFLGREFADNWQLVRGYHVTIDVRYVLLSCAAVLSNYLLATLSWFLTMNALSASSKITFPESVAVVNTTGLTKYIPGKVWSYALQMYWLSKRGFPKGLTLYANLLNLYIALVTSLMMGLLLLSFSPGMIFPPTAVTLLGILLAGELCAIFATPKIIRRLISLLNGYFHREIGYYEIPARLIYVLHLIYFAAAFSFGAGAYLLCFGIGLYDMPVSGLAVMASMMISDVIGFLAVIVPGGLGVREGVMYMLLKGEASGAVSLLLPLATRLVSMSMDIVIGTVAVILLKKNNRSIAAVAEGEMK